MVKVLCDPGQGDIDDRRVEEYQTFVGRTYRTIYDPFLVFEGKRLPAPSKAREREYVSGGTAYSGGIQRFKRGLHGATVEQAAIVGYVQDDGFAQWLTRINSWISDEVVQPRRDLVGPRTSCFFATGAASSNCSGALETQPYRFGRVLRNSVAPSLG
jgi:hypothetical protein